MYDVVIIGGGPAGLSAGIYSARGGLKTLIIEKSFTGGQAATTYEIDNYPGFEEGIGGPDLMMKMDAHARKFDVEFMYEGISSIEVNDKIKKIITEKENVIESKTIILATGAYPRELGIEKEKKLRGAGVSYCATCDGAFYKGKTVAVVGGGNTAVEDAIYLCRFCKKVYLIHRRNELRANTLLQTAAFKQEKIEFVWDSVVEDILGDKKVEGVKVKNVKTGDFNDININGLFVAIGIVPNSKLAVGKVNTDDKGYIITDENMNTSIEGVFAAGDVRNKLLRQVVTAAADGATAAFAAEKYITENI